jgi:hypothetical protein
MAANEFTPTDYLEFIDESQDSKLVAAIPLDDAAIPRVGERVTLHPDDRTVGATYEVKAVTYHFGRRWKSGDPCLLKVTLSVKNLQ